MTQKYAYMVIRTGDEAADIVLTLDRERLPDLFAASLGYRVFSDAVGELRTLLCKPDSELADGTGFGHPLSSAWGAPALHVVPVR